MNMHRTCFFYLSYLFTNINASENVSWLPRMINDGDADACGSHFFCPPWQASRRGDETWGHWGRAQRKGHIPVQLLSFARKQGASARLLVSLAQKRVPLERKGASRPVLGLVQLTTPWEKQSKLPPAGGKGGNNALFAHEKITTLENSHSNYSPEFWSPVSSSALWEEGEESWRCLVQGFPSLGL